MPEDRRLRFGNVQRVKVKDAYEFLISTFYIRVVEESR